MHKSFHEKFGIDEFLKSIEGDRPPAGISDTLAALWWDRKGDWDTAHCLAQKIPTMQGNAVHAYLHRKEGVMWNADYWYARACSQRPSISLEEEWELLVEEMLT